MAKQWLNKSDRQRNGYIKATDSAMAKQ